MGIDRPMKLNINPIETLNTGSCRTQVFFLDTPFQDPLSKLVSREKWINQSMEKNKEQG